MDKQDFQDLKERLAEFAKKAGKEAHDDKDIQKLAEGCIWIGATWMANALRVKGIKDDSLVSSNGRIKFQRELLMNYKERYKRIGESEWFKKHYEDKSLGDTEEVNED